MEPEEPYPSLSGYHDYEPNLEFDDSELQQTPNSGSISGTNTYMKMFDRSFYCDNLVADFIHIEANGVMTMGTSPVAEFIDDNYEEELADARDENFDSLIFTTSSYPEVTILHLNNVARQQIHMKKIYLLPTLIILHEKLSYCPHKNQFRRTFKSFQLNCRTLNTLH